MSKRIVIGIIAGVLVYLLFWPKKEVVKTETQVIPTSEDAVESPQSQQSPQSLPQTQTSPANSAQSSERTSSAEQSSPDQDDDETLVSKEEFLSKEEFEKKVRARDLRDWLKESTQVNGSYLADERGLNQLHDSGVIRVGEKEIQYRYEAMVSDGTGSMSDACSSILTPEGELKFGSLGEGTLKIWRGPISGMQILVIGNQDYFVRYVDLTQSRGFDESGQPTAPITTGSILYYQRQVDDKLTYQGKLVKYTSADPNFKLKGHDYCRESFGKFDQE